MTGDGTLVIAYPRWCFAAGAALCGIACALCTWLAAQAGGPGAAAWALFAAGWAAAAVLGAWGAVRVPPVWRIGADGVAVLGMGLLAWAHIAAVAPRRSGTALRIVLAPGAPGGGGPLRRLGLALRHVPGASPLHLGLTGLGTGAAEIRAAVEHHAPGRWAGQALPGT
ncbi:MAG: hypothetical protein U0237_07870 [Thermoleophilia bacterium]